LQKSKVLIQLLLKLVEREEDIDVEAQHIGNKRKRSE
jgi:hypothetical protein